MSDTYEKILNAIPEEDLKKILKKMGFVKEKKRKKKN